MAFLKRLVRALPLLLISPLLVLLSASALALSDLFSRVASEPDDSEKRGPMSGDAARTGPEGTPCATDQSASAVIPNWNGKDLLEKYLPSVIEAFASSPGSEVIVVDNGSTDGSAEYIRTAFPQVKLIALEKNLGFGGGSNAGFRAAKNRIVVLLNSDMRVTPDFLAPLLDGFREPEVFAVSCQIFFTDPAKLREETGLTQGWWEDGGLRVRHRIDPAVTDLFPCFYGGGGSCAFDREKFLELGGFDPLLEPFYLEDGDLGYMAWKRGWKVFYQPRSVVFHEHRGTIGKRFREAYIQDVLKKNYLLFCWKNIHEWWRLVAHFCFTWAGAIIGVIFGDVPGRPNLAAMWRAFRQLPQALRSRRQARRLARISDTEAFLRPLGGYYRDRFPWLESQWGGPPGPRPTPSSAFPELDQLTDSRVQGDPRGPGGPPHLRVLFVSPYPICPPVHGGGVFMYQTLREMAKLAEVHVVELLDYPHQEKDNLELREFCASAEWLVRPSGHPRDMGSLDPYAVREVANPDLEWLIHRVLYQKRIDILQLEYTNMAQYRGAFRRIATALFEHDIYFQSISRGFGHQITALAEIKARVEYLRALRYELNMLPGFDQVQVCTPANRDYLLSFRPELAPRLCAGLRAGIDTSRYQFRLSGREPLTMLFVGSFRHDPNRIAVDWFVREVLPHILKQEPAAKLVIAGSDPPPPHAYADYAANLEMLGYVEDVRDPLARYSVFVCPILSGSGVRVKLLEAFAAGIPVVSTFVGAEGLSSADGGICALADDPMAFATHALGLLRNPESAAQMAMRARAEVEQNWDMAAITRKLVDGYREIVAKKRSPSTSPYRGPS
jgi:GT2 family glycosyltransferase/glycosyltransferase involved in cell wall biosynthesis